MPTPTATWTAPLDWSDGQLVTADLLDVQLSSNLLYLKTRPYQWQQIPAGTVSTTSTSYVDAASIALTTPGGLLKVLFTGSVTCTANTWALFRLMLNGGVTAELARVSLNSNEIKSAAIAFLFLVGAGTHTIKLQWCSFDGDALYLNLANSTFIAFE